MDSALISYTLWNYKTTSYKDSDWGLYNKSLAINDIAAMASSEEADVYKRQLYCSGEDNAVKTAAKAKDYLSQSGYAYEEVTGTKSSEVQSAATSLAAKCDALYIPIDSTVQAAMEQMCIRDRL